MSHKRINYGAQQQARSQTSGTLFEEPVIYISKVPYSMTNIELQEILKVENTPQVDLKPGNMAPSSGVVRFATINEAERAFAFYNNISLEAKNVLKFHIKDPSSGSDILPNAQILLVKQLPNTININELYDLFRNYGPLYSCKLIHDKNGMFRGQAHVHFFEESAAAEAVKTLHCSDYNGRTLAITNFTPRKNMNHQRSSSVNSVTSVTTTNNNNGSNPIISTNYQNNNQLPQSPNTEGPIVDPCNLFIKNLDANISSSDLFNHFRKFGRIISARVMRDQETGNSKGFGFVSYTNPEEAERAKSSMNNKTLGSKQIVVRLHEPKKLRETKPTFNGPASPTESRAPSRRNSEIYTVNAYNEFNQEELSDLAPKARREVLMSELQKRFRHIPSIPLEEVNPIIDILLAYKLPEVLHMFEDPQALQQKITEARQQLKGKNRRGSDENNSVSTTPHMPSVITPIIPASPMASLVPVPEREKFLRAIRKFNPRHSQEVLDLIMSLSKKERSLCYFNSEYLDKKIVEAIAALEFTQDDDSVMTPSTTKTSTPREFSPASTPTKSPEPIGLNKGVVTPPKTAEKTGHYVQNDSLYEETEQFLRMLEQKPIVERKQKLGDKLFPKVKSLGLRSAQASKVTINLLDTDDLRELAHSMNDAAKFKAKVDAAIVKVNALAIK